MDALWTTLPKNAILTQPEDLAPYLKEERGLMESDCEVVVRPANTEDIAKAVAVCAEHGVSVVPLGGNTGLVGGGVASGGIILSLERLNKIIGVDALNHTMTVEAGCVLANIQTAAQDAGCLFPLSLGAEGSCQIGGNLATNAGGVNVLRYGNTRELVLGIEAVLPDGRIYDGLNALRKDNTGYDLKQLFIGAEGTLGIITKAVLKLYPAPRSSVTVMAALPRLDGVLTLFDRVRAACGDRLTAFELVPRLGLELGIAHVPGVDDPFADSHPHYTLIELTSPREGDNLRSDIETVLEHALEGEVITDAVIAESEAQVHQLWRIREELPSAQSREGGSIKHDVSVPVSSAIEFIEKASQAVEAEIPGIRVCAFGHIGDGNIHYNLTQPPEMDKRAFLDNWECLNRIVHDIVVDMNGSISAEHGIGLLKKMELDHYSPSVKLDVLRQIKRAIDPNNIMNPGKIFDGG
ncbi:MAG: FAD-binding oxidoreductase [Rhodospirillales bacterium]|nr:FAD-binding oxidoreductase [Rhodospirillales bacterium]